MTLLEMKSRRKAKAIKYMVDKGEYSAGYGLKEAERLNDEGLLIDADYLPLAEYLEPLVDKEIETLLNESVEEPIEEPVEEVEEMTN